MVSTTFHKPHQVFNWLAISSLLAGLVACNSVGPSAGLFKSASPHEQYEQSLRTAKLDHTALGTDWLDVANRALNDSLRITIPYRESGYFSSGKPFAVGYQLDAQRGDKLIIKVDVQGQKEAQVFIDVFELGENTRTNPPRSNQDRPSLVASSKADTNQLVWEVRRTRTHLIRIQPELLRSGRYTISVSREPVLSFPVQGRSSRQISSFFGAPRDAGQRRHEGVDIFAPRGTPALASASGTISGVGVNSLGGNVVFLSDPTRNQRLYYAHLDRWNVTEGQRVAVGDTIGFVGNTGNARTTSPHLHFGIYQFSDGAVDPLPFIRLGSGPAKQPLLPDSRLGNLIRSSATRTLVRIAPMTDSPIIHELPRASALTIVGGTSDWLRVELPDGNSGYVSSITTEAATRPIRKLTLPVATDILDAANPSAAVMETLGAGSSVEVLGVFGVYQLVRLGNQFTGWIRR